MAERFGPYVCNGVIDCGHLMDFVCREASAAKTTPRARAIQVFEGIKTAHADWLRGHNLRGRALRRAGSPFRAAYDDLEHWLEETAPPKRSRAKSGFVYVIGMEDDATAVKIGFATKVDERCSTLQTSSHHSLKVLVTLKGSQATEKELHRKFAADRIRGEWFRKSEAIDAFITAKGQCAC